MILFPGNRWMQLLSFCLLAMILCSCHRMGGIDGSYEDPLGKRKLEVKSEDSRRIRVIIRSDTGQVFYDSFLELAPGVRQKSVNLTTHMEEEVVIEEASKSGFRFSRLDIPIPESIWFARKASN